MSYVIGELHLEESPHGIMAKVLDCSLEVRKFKLYYVHF